MGEKITSVKEDMFTIFCGTENTDFFRFALVIVRFDM